MIRYILGREEKCRAAASAESFLATRRPWQPLKHADTVRLTAETLPQGLRRFLLEARSREDDVILLSNLPVSPNLGPTPEGWKAAEAEEAGAFEEVLLLLCASLMGDPFGWANQQQGRLIHDVCPSNGMEESLTSASSRAELSLHTEDVFHTCRGDYVALSCLRNPDRIATTVARVDPRALSERTRSVLREDRFLFYADDSHTTADTGDHHERPYELASVLFGPDEDPYLRIDGDFTIPVAGDKDARDALSECLEHLSRSTEQLLLTPGDAVFLDNYRVVHGRNAFTPRYDGTDRWLKRISVMRDVRRAYVHTQSRSRVMP